jgi:hypothetical protein
MSNVDWTSLPKRRGETLYSGGGGDTSDPMEARVKLLEDDMKEVKSDLKAIRVDLAEIKGKLSTMPTTLQLLGFIIAVLAIAGLARVFAP